MINAEGDIIFTVLVFTGKTARCLPNEAIRDKYPDFVYEHSVNHWSNHDIQVRLLKKTWQWVVTDFAKRNRVSLAEAELRARCIHFLDCWPVNLTEKLRTEIRQSCPGMTLMYLAAGSTGSKQVSTSNIKCVSRI